MSDDKLDEILKIQLELNGRLTGLSIAVAHLFAIEAGENPGGAAERAIGDVEGTVEGIIRQMPDARAELRDGVIAQLRQCLGIAAAQVDRVKRQAPTSTSRN